MIGWDGHKMSKSRGNLVLVSRLRAEGVEPGRHPARTAGRALPRGPVVERRGARRGQRAADAVARPRRRCPRGPTRPMWSPGCAGTSPTTSTPRKRLPRLMVGPPTRSSTAATTPRRRGRWRQPSTRCWGQAVAAARRDVIGGYVSAMGSVNGKVALITGGANGIGAEVARRLHAKGAKLVLTDLDEARLKRSPPSSARTGCSRSSPTCATCRRCRPPSTRASSGSAASTSWWPTRASPPTARC